MFKTSRRFLAVSIVVFVTLVAGLAYASPEKSGQVFVLAPDTVRMQPDSQYWAIPLSLFSVDDSSPARLVSLSINGLPVKIAANSASNLPVNLVGGLVRQDLSRFIDLRRRDYQGHLTSSESQELKALGDNVQRNIVGQARLATLKIEMADLPVTIQDWTDYTIQGAITQGANSTSFAVTVASRSLPADSSWSPADLHLHSTFSDGHLSPSDLKLNLFPMGYRILYITDHTDLIPEKAGSWANYSSTITSLSDTSIALYPGAEFTIVDASYNPAGDILAYGINSLTGLTNKVYYAQTGINNVLSNNPSGPSSPSIAHPYGSPSWQDWTVTRYRGLELMSGLQTNFSDTADPMTRWKSELSRLLNSTFSDPEHYFASARAGSDWHASVLDPAHPGYVAWVRTGGQWSSKSAVDSALYSGYTIASRKGGLAYMTLTYSGVSHSVGERFTGVPVGSMLSLSIVFKPVESGTYSVYVRDDTGINRFSYTGSFSGGGTYYPASGYNFTFDGGQHCYYLYLAGPDYIYSSPIFVKQ